jgi:hypothetical protein
MDTNSILFLSFSAYKISGILVGGFFGYLGYKLFVSGIWGDAGTLQAAHKDSKFLLKSAAPGTFFVVLGAFVISVTLFKGVNLYHAVGADTISTSKPQLPEGPR